MALSTEEVLKQAEEEFRKRVFAKMLRALPKPTYRCGGAKQHTGADFALVEWHIEGTGDDDDWWCDECSIAIHNGSELLQAGNNGHPKCAKCGIPLVEAAQRRPVVVKARPCLRCGVIFWDKVQL